MRLGVFDIGLVLDKLGRMWTHSFAISGLVCIARNARIRRGRRQEILFGNDKARCRLLVFGPSLEITLSAPHDEWPGKPVVGMAVIVLWYNVERCVREFRCMAFDQECDASFETVVVGDGSTDDTRGVLGTMVNDGCLGMRNKGFSGARAIGLKAANGATIAFVGSDDYLASGALQALMRSRVAPISTTGGGVSLRRRKGRAIPVGEKEQSGVAWGSSSIARCDAVSSVPRACSIRTPCMSA